MLKVCKNDRSFEFNIDAFQRLCFIRFSSMKLIFSLYFIFSFNLWAQCLPAKYKFKEQAANFSKVILIPGAGSENDDLYLGFIRYGKYFSQYTLELHKRGIPFEVLHSSPTGNEGIEQRTKKLIRKLIKEDDNVLVIGHSLGGLVARLALRDPEAAGKVAATVTVSTPHQGTPISDWLLAEGKLPYGAALLARAFGFDLKEKKYLAEISVKNKDEWDTEEDHQRHIQNLFTVIASQTPEELLKSNPLFALGDQIVRKSAALDTERVSDGLIPRPSQAWGECLLFVKKNHGSVLGKDIFNFPSRDVLPQILDNLAKKGIEFI